VAPVIPVAPVGPRDLPPLKFVAPIIIYFATIFWIIFP